MGGVVQSVSHAVSSAFQSIGSTISKIGEAAIHNPVGTIASVAAVATGQVWALPLISAVDTIAHGGNLEKAALSAGASYLGGEIASGVTNSFLAPASNSLSSIVAEDAASMASQGLSGEQIAQALQQSYPEITADIANSISNAASAGIAAPTLATAYAGAFGSELNGVLDSTAQRILATSAGNSVGNAARTLATTGKLDQAALSALSAGAGSAIGGGTTALTSDTLGAGASNILGKVTGATASAFVNNTNPNMAAANSLVNNLIATSLSSVGQQLNLPAMAKGLTNSLTNMSKELVNNFSTTADKIDQQQTEAQNYYTNTVKSSYDAAQNSYNNLMNANGAYSDAYKKYSDDYSKYEDLVKQYNDAKSNNDVTTANNLAGQINQLITSLNSQVGNLNSLQTAMTNAGNDYNKAYDVYKTAGDNYQGQIQSIKDSSASLTNDIKQASADVSGYLNNLKDVTNQVNKLSTTANYSFYDNFNKTGDINGSLSIANNVNSLDDKGQATYYNALSRGLTNDQAITFAQNYSNLGANAQNELIQSAKTGGNDYFSQILAATQQLVDPGSTVSNINAPSSLANQKAIDYYNAAVSSGVDPATALKTATDYQTNLKSVAENVISFLTGSSNAQAGELPKEGTVTVTGAPSTGTTDTQQATGPSMPQYTKAMIDEALASGDLTQEEATNYLNKLSASGQSVPTSSDVSVPTYQDLINNLFNVSAKTTGTGAGTATAGTGTTGTAAAGTGTGAGIGTGGGTGGGTGTGTGGGGGTGTGTGTGTSFTPGVTNLTGSTGTGQQYGGVTNLTGTLGGGKQITLVGEPGTQETTATPMAQSYQPGINFEPVTFASGGSTTADYTPIGGSSGITPLTATRGGSGNKIKLLGSPVINSAMNPIQATQYLTNPIQALVEQAPVVHLAEGGLPDPTYDYKTTGFPRMSPLLIKGRRVGISGLPGANAVGDMSGALMGLGRHAEGGEIHNPEFYSEGGLKNRYVQGDGDGTSDDVPAMLANGEFVIPADVVSALGNGSNESGAQVLDEFMQVIRAHKQKHNPKKLPPDSKGPLAYLEEAKRKVK